MNAMSRCPSCQRPVAPKGDSFPFCTERCRLIDLGRWLGNEYRVPVASADEDDDGDVAVPAGET